MTPFASVALFKRGSSIVFKPPRKEAPSSLTQARKAAMRYWRGHSRDGDTLTRVVVLREVSGKLEISERNNGAPGWTRFERELSKAAGDPHFAARLAELGIDASAAPPAVPDVLIINGFTYRRDI